MSTISRTITIHAPPERVFALVTDPHRVGPFIPGLIRYTNVPPLPLHVGSAFDWEYQFLGIIFRGAFTVEQYRPPHLYISRSRGGIESTWTYTLLPQGTSTLLSFTIDYGPPTSLIKQYAQKFIEPHTEKLAETFLQSMRAYLELAVQRHAGGEQQEAS